ncbi:MAG: T9SS type A sorting domain-containing protein [Chlorobi bacterium]|nr:T9SS type A sorting domain-containing protein [Chlorobiota bacterium]
MKKIVLIIFGILLVSIQIQAQFTLTDSLKAYFPFNNNANDESGNGHNGTVNGGATLTTDRFGNTNSAYSFDGVDDDITMLNLDLLQPASISIWINSDNSQNGPVYVSDYSDSYWANYYGLVVSFKINGKISASFGNGSYPNHGFTTLDSITTTNIWHHIVVNWDTSGSISIYLDALQMALSESGNTNLKIASNQGEDDCFGRDDYQSGGNHYYKGLLDDIRIYNRILTDNEIDSLAHEGGWVFEDLIPPSAPAGLTASSGDQQITLIWDQNTEPDVDQYNIYRDLSSPAVTLIDSVHSPSPPDTFYIDTTPVIGRDYYYRITAKDTAGNESGFSNEVSVAIPFDLYTDSLALVALYDSTGGANWTNNTNWLTGPVSTWFGITVSGGRVTEILLDSNNIVGTIPPEIGNLANLQILKLDHNQFSGTIPPEIGNLSNLTELTLWANKFTGIIPSEIGNLTSLTILDLDDNLLSGEIPSEIGNLINLEEFWSCKNQLTGSIPSSIGNLTNLTVLSVWENQLTGIMPPGIGNLINLKNLSLSDNHLTGGIPSEVGNLSELDYLGLTNNQLTNSIPIEIGNLDSLKTLALGGNQLSGSIPPELQNLNKLTKLYLWGNQLTGSIPPEIGNLVNLINLQLSSNLLTGTIPPEFGNLVNLEVLYLWGNQLTGAIPTEIGNLSGLINLSLLDNQLSGSIPSEIGNLTSLETLFLNNNQFTDLPDLSFLTTLNDLHVENNKLMFSDIEPNLGVASNTFTYAPQDSVGERIDTTILVGTSFTLSVSTGGASSVYQWKKNGTNIGTLSGDSTYTLNPVAFSDSGVYTCVIANTVATDLTLYSRPVYLTVVSSYLQQDSLALVALYDSTDGGHWTNNANWLTGPVSTWYGITVSGNRVTEISFDHNNLIGTIPPSIGDLDSLRVLNLPDNQLSGTIPSEIGNLGRLQHIDLNMNQLSGSIPAEMGNLSNLNFINLSMNQLTGSIPVSIGNLSGLINLQLNNNFLSGSIPAELGNLINLQTLWLQINQLSGTIPVETWNLSSLVNLQLFHNQLSGMIPPEIGNLSNLVFLNLQENQFTGLADLSLLGSLDELTIEYNKLTFKDIEPNIGVAGTTFTYTPQDSVGVIIDTTVYAETSYTMSVSTGGTSSRYQWKKDGTNIGTVSGDSTYTINPVAFSDSGTYTCEITNTVATGLTLYSRPVNFSVDHLPIYYDSLALVALYDSTDGANWTNNTNWLTGPVSTWFGVTVSGGRVTEISFDHNNLNGTIPHEIGNLTDLTLLSLEENQLAGSIPTEIGNLTNLSVLRLYNSQISGLIPSEIGNLTNLTFLDFNSNQLTGSIPVEIGNLTNLEFLDFSNNQFSGSIPPEIGNLLNLETLVFDRNQLSGSIPSTIGNLTKLVRLHFGNNQLTGSIPDEIGNLTNLNWLELGNNQLTGSIPVNIGNLTDLTLIEIANNQFTGLPNLTSLDSLAYLLIENNRFTFEDIEPNIGVPDSAFIYSPQDSVGEIIDTTVYVGTSYTMSVSTGGASSLYQWKKDGVSIGNISSDSTYTIIPVAFSDSGTYTCEITNTVATDLTLYSRPIHVRTTIISTFPYSEDFESGNGGWYTGGANTSWQYGIPTGPTINSAASGNNAWVTNLSGEYNPDEVSYIKSPRFDLSGINYPKIEFNIWWDAEGFYDGANLQYKQGTGEWQTLGSDKGNGTWYNSSYLFAFEKGFGFDINHSAGWSGDNVWGYGSNGWVTVSHDLLIIDKQTDVAFRIAFASNDTYQNDGVAIDDIHIFGDPTGIHDVTTSLSEIQIYPNPNEGKFYLVYKGEKESDLKLQLINLQGQVLFEKQFFSPGYLNEKLDLSFLSKGIYYLKITGKYGFEVRILIIQ